MTTSNILMIRPVRFAFNTQTADSNAFQQSTIDATQAQGRALQEFENMVAALRQAKVNVTVIEDTPEPFTPDSIFPNNWVSFHNNGQVVLYPMQAENRRLERRLDILETLQKTFEIKDIVDLSHFEAAHKFLEGTGSMVLDSTQKIVYACLSPRTNEDVLEAFGNRMEYEIIKFTAHDVTQKAIYHTNVLMCVADTFVVICSEAITDTTERLLVLQSLRHTRKAIVEISFEQMNNFAGNMLLINNDLGERLLVMSSRAKRSLTISQIDTLNTHATILDFDLSTIEQLGGGSARCMMAEVFLPS
jgi:hypothetical protein